MSVYKDAYTVLGFPSSGSLKRSSRRRRKRRREEVIRSVKITKTNRKQRILNMEGMEGRKYREERTIPFGSPR